MEKTIENMTRKEFEQLPHRKWDQKIICNALIILPSEISWVEITKYKLQLWLSKRFKFIKEPEIYNVTGMHDSGYRQMDFVAVGEDNKPICLLAGGSDVMHFNGIGGYGYDWLEKYGTVPSLLPPVDWNIDCLPTSGLLRLFSHNKILCGIALSSFEFFAIDEKR
jgi:hypothetical protein